MQKYGQYQKIVGRMMPQRFVRSMAVILGMAMMNTADAGPLDRLFETKPPYPVTRSDLVYARQFSVQPIYWLDNDRVLIPGGGVVKPSGSASQDWVDRPYGVYIWDIRKNSISRYSDLEKSGPLLYYDHGNIAYSLSTDKAMTVAMIGMMGEEKRTVLNRGQGGQLPELFPSMGPGPRISDLEGSEVRTYDLLPGKGHILVATAARGKHTINQENQDQQVKLYLPGHDQAIELPILAKEMDFSAVFTYSDYLGKYVLLPHMPKTGDVRASFPVWKATDAKPVYSISPEGEVEVLAEIPSGIWSPGAVYPTRQGLFWVSNTTRGNSRDAGGWLIKNGKVTKLFDQLVDAAGVSPDGCIIAFANNDFNPKTNEFVTAIHLCAENQN